MIKRIALITVAALSLAACTTVEEGERGVVKDLGAVESVALNPGLHWYNPLTTTIIPMDVKTTKWESKTNAYTKDVQNAEVGFNVLYKLRPGAVVKTYTDYQEDWAGRQIPAVVVQSIKDVFGRSEAVKDAINNRQVVQTQIEDKIRTKLAKRGIDIVGFELTDISFSAAFEKAVEQKQVAVELANASKNKTVQIQEQARQKVITAEADAKAIQIKAEALSQNPAYADLEWIAAWRATGGKVPETMIVGNGASVPFLPMKK